MNAQPVSHEFAKVERKLPDYGLLLKRLEEAVVSDSGRDRLAKVLGRESAWKRLPPEAAVRWARLAQIIGMWEVSLQVLTWVNTRHPENTEAWKQRVELLELLGRGEEAPSGRFSEVAPKSSGAEGGKALPGKVPGEGPPWDDELAGPFTAVKDRREALDHYMNLFQGREDCFARQWADRREGTHGYVPVRRPLTAADIQEHLSGGKTYGIYLLQQDSRVRLAVVDADLVPRLRSGIPTARDRELLAREKRYLLGRLPEIGREKKLPCLSEFTGGKGFHFWFFFSDPVPAGAARRALQGLVRHLAADLTCFTLEVFPKQDQLAGKGLGNLVKLPLGIHRVTGKPSYFLHITDRSTQAQLAFLKNAPIIEAKTVLETAQGEKTGTVVVHPREEAWAGEFPELALLRDRCVALSQIMVNCRQARSLSLREEKVLLGTLGFLPRGKTLLHHLLQPLPEYNPHLTDFRLSRLRGKPLGCRKIHALLNLVGDFCRFEKVPEYAHPLLHLPQWEESAADNKAERITNLQDALDELKHAVALVERFMKP